MNWTLEESLKYGERTWDKSYGFESQGGFMVGGWIIVPKSLRQLVWLVMEVITSRQNNEQTKMLVWTTWHLAIVASPAISHPEIDKMVV